jgi:hypothetical protein
MSAWAGWIGMSGCLIHPARSGTRGTRSLHPRAAAAFGGARQTRAHLHLRVLVRDRARPRSAEDRAWQQARDRHVRRRRERLQLGSRPRAAARWSIELDLWQLGPTHLRTGDAPTRFKQPRLTHGSSGGVAVGGLATAARLLAPAVGDLRLPDLAIQAAVSKQLRLVRSLGSPQRVFLVPVGVGRNRLVCSSLPRQTPVTLSRDARVAGPRGPAELAPIHFFTRSELLMFMNCPDCGLKVRLVAPYLLLERCPRCLVRRRQIVEMRVTTDLPNDASAPAPLRHSAG